MKRVKRRKKKNTSTAKRPAIPKAHKRRRNDLMHMQVLMAADFELALGRQTTGHQLAMHRKDHKNFHTHMAQSSVF